MKEEILDNHRYVVRAFGISTKFEELDLPTLYWISKLHNCPCKQCYVSRSVKCSTEPVSILLTYFLSVVKTWHHSYWNTSYSRVGFNQMWILKPLKVCQGTYNQDPFPAAIALKHQISLPSTQLFPSQSKKTGYNIQSNCASKKNGQRAYKCIVL